MSHTSLVEGAACFPLKTCPVKLIKNFKMLLIESEYGPVMGRKQTIPFAPTEAADFCKLRLAHSPSKWAQFQDEGKF